MRTKALAIAVAAATAVLSGCAAGSTTARHWANPASWGNQVVADEPVLIAVPRPVAVDVETFSGNISITCDPELSEATVTLVREAIHGLKRAGEARSSLPEIEFTTNLSPGPVLEVRAWTNHPEPHFQHAHLDIRLPAASAVRVRTSHGRVRVLEFSGAVDVETDGGDVRLITNTPIHEPVRVVNRTGDVDYRVRDGSSGIFDCEAVRGEVAHRIPIGRHWIHRGTDHDTLQSTLNGGVNPVVLRTVDGDIRVAVVKEPAAVGTVIVDP